MLDKILCVFEVVERLASQWFGDVCQHLCHPICYGIPTGHYGPEVGANFAYFGEAIKLGGTTLVGHSFLHFESLIPPVCFMSFNVCICLFLSLDVGSLLRTLYVLVSCSSNCALLMQSCFSMMTMVTPLSVVSTTLDVSCLGSVNTLHSCIVRLVLWLWSCLWLSFLSLWLISDLSSSASLGGVWRKLLISIQTGGA